MNVCLVSQEYPPETAHGGIGTQTWNKAQSLSRLGHHIQVLSCAAGPGPEVQTRVDSAGVSIHRMRPPGEGPGEQIPIYEQAVYGLGYTWSVLRNLHRLMATHQFDIINFPEYGAEGFAYQLNRSPWNWVPTIVQLHGPLAMCTDRYGWPERDSEFYRVGTFMEGTSIRLADGLMASSANIADFTAGHYGVPREAIDVVHCGIDIEAFRPGDERQRLVERPTILFIGNIAASKGVRTVFEAVMRLRSKYPDIRLQILGRGGEDLVQGFRSRARAEGAEANLEFPDFVQDREALPEFYRRAHIVASPAFHEVGVANVYVEAMACGCPVVAANTGGAPEAVTHGETGLLVTPNDVEATQAAFDRLLGDAATRQRMGEAGRRRVEQYFAREHYIGRVLAAYQKAIERSRQKLDRLQSEKA